MSFRILVVEDHADTAEMLAKWVQLAGHSVQVCRTGYQAMLAAPTFLPDVVLLDIGLPDMNGWDFATWMRGDSRFERTRIIAVSAYQTRSDRHQSAAAGVDLHLGKPVHLNDVLGALAAAERS